MSDIDKAEANIKADYKAGKISKEQFQKEMMIVVGARHHEQQDQGAKSSSERVLGAIAAERARQIASGYDAAHDDAHLAGEIINSSWGASARIYAAQDCGMSGDAEGYTKYLVQAAAQIVAEIERVQRAAPHRMVE